MSEGRQGFLREAFFNGNGVAKRLIVALVLFSTLVTTVVTIVELGSEYRSGVGQIDRSLAFIGESALPSLTDGVWVSDREQVQMQIDGLLRLPHIEYIGIATEGSQGWTAGKQVSRRSVKLDLPLVRAHRGQPLTIGRLQAVASVDQVLDRLWDLLLVTLIGNAVKTILVAGFMLLVFQYFVTRHLSAIAAFVRRIEPSAPRGEQLQLDRPVSGRWRPDILDTVTANINRLSQALRDARDESQQSVQRLAAVTHETSAYLYEIDCGGVITYANRSHPGLGGEQVEGTRLVDWYPAALRPKIEQAMKRACAGAQPQRLDYALPDSIGRVHSYTASLTPVRQDGAVRSMVLTAVDVSEMKSAEGEIRALNSSLEARVRERTQQLENAMVRVEAASRAKSEFLSRMSHELRTPLNAVLGFAQLIEVSELPPKEKRWAGEIRRAGEHLLRMIEELLDLARIEAGKMVVRSEVLDPDAILDEALALVKPLIESRGLTLQRHRADAGSAVRADPLRLRQVLVNLLSNAIKYNRAGGSIELRCVRRGEVVRLSVRDSGPGIAPEQLTRLFQPFERLGAEHGSVEGTGIGLALSQQLTDLMGGSLGADSQPGVGSTFWVELAHVHELPASAGAAASAAGPAVEIAGDVLYIEDKASNIELVAACLAPHPKIRLRAALSGGAGLAAAREQRPDLILLDIQFPGMDGFEVLRELRADPSLREVPVFAVTADAQPDKLERARAAGFDRYFAKPIDLAALLGAMREVLARGRGGDAS